MTTHRIVTWNMGYRVSTHDDAWRYLFDDNGEVRADVALVQECVLPEWVRQEYSHVWKPAWRTTKWGTAIVARNATVLTELTGPNEFSRYVTGHVSLASTRFLVASIHAATEPRVIPPLQEIFRALAPLRGERFIVGGDFNTARSAEQVWPGYGHAEFWSGLDDNGYVSCYLHEHGEEAMTYAHPRGRFRGQADHLLVDEPTASTWTLRCRVLDDRSLSDHRPLMLEMTAGPSAQ
jgi:endonuclease/exonuclease/phosphatase (EEP) superfamily protein YafD